VTTINAAAARRRHPKVALAVVLTLAGLGLAGCESSSSLFGLSLPGFSTPDSAVATPAPEAQPQPPLAKVAVAPIIGAPDAIGKQIHQEFTSAIGRQRVAVTSSKEEKADYTLRGYVVAAKDKNAIKVSYIWDVTDPSGKRVNRITGEESAAGSAGSKDPWSAVTPQVAQSITGKAANQLASWLQNHSAQPAVAAAPASVGAPAAAAPVAATPPPPAKRQAVAKAPAAEAAPAAAAPPAQASTTTGSIGRDGPVTAVVPSVTGAPGDGSKSLTAAIQRELTSKGVAVSDKPATVAYRVEGTVTVGEAKQGKQPIHIEWLVRDPQGKKLGTVSQRNEIPEGSLDGEWGKTADQAAGAAAQGIVKLLPQPKAIN
jgi:hypothetical protein